MNHRLEVVRSLWSDWPDLPTEAIYYYQIGSIDDDPSFAELALALVNLETEDIDEYLVVGCEKHVMYRVVGCFCFQCCRLLEGTSIENICWLDEVLEVIGSRGNDPDTVEIMLDFITIEQINDGIKEVLSVLNSDQLGFFVECMQEVLSYNNEALANGADIAENSPEPELLELALKKIKELGLMS